MPLIMKCQTNSIAAFLTFCYPLAVSALGKYLLSAFQLRQNVVIAGKVVHAVCSIEPDSYLAAS